MDFFHEITEGRMRCKPTKERKIQLLHDLENDDGYVVLKRAAEDRRMQTQKGCKKNLLYSKRWWCYEYGSHQLVLQKKNERLKAKFWLQLVQLQVKNGSGFWQLCITTNVINLDANNMIPSAEKAHQKVLLKPKQRRKPKDMPFWG